MSGCFSADTIERVKESADIVEIISAHTDLRRQGQRFTGLCPFHEERTPSFSVDPREKLYYCFGCEVGGDVIKFVEEKEGLGFPEAVEALAERYGVEVEREEEDPRAEEARKRRARLCGAARAHGRVLRDAFCGTRRRRRRRATTWRGAGSARRCCARSGSATRRAPGTRC